MVSGNDLKKLKDELQQTDELIASMKAKKKAIESKLAELSTAYKLKKMAIPVLGVAAVLLFFIIATALSK